MTFLSLVLLLLSSEIFTVDASSEAAYSVSISREALRDYVDDIGLLTRNMPGVARVTPLGENRYLYQTEKDIPFSRPFKTDFIIRKIVVGDSLTVYRSENVNDENYMSCKVKLFAEDGNMTRIGISLRIRLSRKNPSEIHWLAPIVGEQFISDRMNEDLEEMLKVFIQRSNRELYNSLLTSTAGS